GQHDPRSTTGSGAPSRRRHPERAAGSLRRRQPDHGASHCRDRRGPHQRRRPDALSTGTRHGPGLREGMTPSAEWRLKTRCLGRRVLVFDRLDSTNTFAAALAHDPANEGVVVLAREQTAGRGQYQRTWQAPAGTSVLLSVLLFPPPTLRRPALLTAWAAVSVCEAILQLTGLQAKIKWPNDVLIRGRKVCGILIEQRTVASGPWLLA